MGFFRYNSWQHVCCQYCYQTCFFSSRGRVLVHHLSLSSGHCWNGDRQWQPLPIAIPVLAFFLLLICMQKQTIKNPVSNCWNGDRWWWPLLITISALAWTQAQVVIQHSTWCQNRGCSYISSRRRIYRSNPAVSCISPNILNISTVELQFY